MHLQTIQSMRKALKDRSDSHIAIEGGESDYYFIALHGEDEPQYLKSWFGYIKMFRSLSQAKDYLKRRGFKTVYLETHNAYEEMIGHDERQMGTKGIKVEL